MVDQRALPCRAPSVVMDFDPAGNVSACCVNSMHPLGNVGQSSLRELWQGDRARALRAAVLRGDFGFGCGVCRYRLEHDAGFVMADYYAQFPVSEDPPQWPQLMAFALGNTCNVACVMCGGDLSSRIRTQREHRSPLISPYGDEFFEELVEFLPHLARAEFRGGEPFLARANQRVWDLMDGLGLDTPMGITTNGTVWDDRVEKLLDRFPVDVTFSIDGMTAGVNSRIRVGTDHDVALENARRFADHARVSGRWFNLSMCVLRHNWHELGAILRFGEELGCEVAAQPVFERDHALERLPTDELAAVLVNLELEGEALEPELRINAGVWHDILGRVRYELGRRSGDPVPRLWEHAAPDNPRHVAEVRRFGTTRASGVPGRRRGDTATARRHREELARWSPSGEVAVVLTDRVDGVIAADLAPITPPGQAPLPATGTFADTLEAITTRWGGHLWIADEFVDDGVVEQTLFVTPSPYRDKTGIVLRLLSSPEGGRLGRGGRVRTLIAADPVFWPPATAVSAPLDLPSRRQPARSD